ncbi:hypothetical protein HPB49_016745 [Dermacentor silvarum]|uniref:Uncharacterized protein n=1 Tax=Dermacentor silvarum TaxID=543639 RepID=A0ACB8D6D0_DERSI|nr:uncharacterized protein LOC119446294 [Dermacentor silvarum]KAH7960075.1 hypothetical protein HPB49_016745 [Dermacentor silvarum]
MTTSPRGNSRSGSGGSAGPGSRRTHFRESQQVPQGTPRDMYDSLLSDVNKRETSKSKPSIAFTAPHDNMDSPFGSLEEFRDFMYSYYTEGQSMIAHMRDRVPRDLPEVAQLLEASFKRYVMLKLELDCYFSTVVNYSAERISKEDLRYWPNHILKNMDENMSWIMELIRRRPSLSEFYNDTMEQLKMLLYQMRSATQLYDWQSF